MVVTVLGVMYPPSSNDLDHNAENDLVAYVVPQFGQKEKAQPLLGERVPGRDVTR